MLRNIRYIDLITSIPDRIADNLFLRNFFLAFKSVYSVDGIFEKF